MGGAKSRELTTPEWEPRRMQKVDEEALDGGRYFGSAYWPSYR